jgi:hypothetical protein
MSIEKTGDVNHLISSVVFVVTEEGEARVGQLSEVTKRLLG